MSLVLLTIWVVRRTDIFSFINDSLGHSLGVSSPRSYKTKNSRKATKDNDGHSSLLAYCSHLHHLVELYIISFLINISPVQQLSKQPCQAAYNIELTNCPQNQLLANLGMRKRGSMMPTLWRCLASTRAIAFAVKNTTGSFLCVVWNVSAVKWNIILSLVGSHTSFALFVPNGTCAPLILVPHYSEISGLLMQVCQF